MRRTRWRLALPVLGTVAALCSTSPDAMAATHSTPLAAGGGSSTSSLAPRTLLTSRHPPVIRQATGQSSVIETVSNLVANPMASSGVGSWTAASDAGPIKVTSVALPAGAPAAHAIQIARPAATGSWAFALAELQQPSGFVVGQTYQMQVWVRDLNASGQAAGILLANGNYSHRPTDASVFGSYRDTAWHRLTRTFLCTGTASPDTALYVSLPSKGSLGWQLTAATVAPVKAASPTKVGPTATRSVTFNGAAGSAPDAQMWNREVGGNGWGNNELQTYTGSTSNSSVDGSGNLALTARREQATGPDGIQRQYTSARLTTQGKLEIQPGSYVEATIKAPVGKGVWPAFWLIGTNQATVGWPACGELDVLEGQGATPTVAYSALHASATADPSKDASFGWGDAGGAYDLGTPLDSGFHTYGVYFDGSTVRFYIDRTERMSLWATDATDNGRTWPFSKPQFLVLNVAVDHTVDATTSFPRTMTVKSIAQWQGGIPF
ncbi:MAG: glycoside hydrolase family 16 [Frondihabitans sp.]|nr:glycoside hydrolase family 16 [Frondihabitans sp.]